MKRGVPDSRTARSESGWVVRSASTKDGLNRTLRDRSRDVMRWSGDHPVMAALVCQTLLFVLAVVLYDIDAPLGPSLSPKDPASGLGLTWQVDAVSVSLAFAGLALLFQLATDNVLTGISVRTALFRETWFEFAFSFSILGLAVIGALAIWFQDDSTLAVAFLVTLMSLGAIAYAYSRAGIVFRNPALADALGVEQLLFTLRSSVASGWAEARGNVVLIQVLPALMGGTGPEHFPMKTDLVRTVGRLADVNAGMIQGVLADLQRIAGAASGEGQSIAALTGNHSAHVLETGRLALRMNYSIGRNVRPERPVFSLLHEQVLPPVLIDDVEKRLRRAIRLAGEEDVPFEAFRSEMRDLSDASTRSLITGDYGRVQQSLSLYRRLLSELLSETKRINALVGSSDSTNHYSGREWEVLLGNLYRFVEVLVRQENEMPLTDFLGFVTGACRDSAQLDEWSAWRSYWRIADTAWSAYLERSNNELALRIPNSLYHVAFTARAERDDTHEALVTEVAAAFVRLIKTAVDAEHEQVAIECVDYFVNGLDLRYASDSARGSKNRVAERFRRSAAACLLLCYAWVLFLAIERGQSDMAALRARLEEALQGLPVWDALMTRVTERVWDLTGAKWWEVQMKGGMGGGQLILSDYLMSAALLVGVRVPGTAEAEAKDFELAARLKWLLDDTQRRTYSRSAVIANRDPSSDRSLRDALDDLVETQARLKEEALAVAALSGERVSQFEDAFRDHLREWRQRALSAWFPDSASRVDVATLIGWRGWVPKEYFAESDVYADPEDLGRSLADAICRAEDERVIEALFSAACIESVAMPVALDAPGWIGKRLSDRGDWVILTNSRGALDALAPDWWAQASADGSHYKSKYGIPCWYDFNDRPPFVVLAARGQSVSISTGAANSPVSSSGDREPWVHVQVRDPSVHEVQDLLEDDPALDETGARVRVLVEVSEDFNVGAVGNPQIFWLDVAGDER